MPAASPPHTPDESHRRRGSSRAGASHPRWRGAWRALSWAFLLLVCALVVRHALKTDWRAVGDALRQASGTDLLLAALLAAVSHLLYATFDLIGRHQTKHRLSVRQTLGVGFVSYAFNLNFGALIGGVGFRFRQYAQLGLRAPVISQILALSVLTNWVGYFLVGGLLFALEPPALPDDWALSTGGLRAIGAGLLLGVTGYFLLCAVSGGRALRWRGRSFHLPTLPIALLQACLSACNWLVASGIVYVLLGEIDYALVTSVFLTAAVAGAMAHVPAGLGVLEAVFIALLGHAMPSTSILAGLLAYRAVYYLGPLALAGVVLLASRKSKRARRARMSSSERA